MFAQPAPDSLPPQIGIKHYFAVQRYCFALIGIDPTSLEKTIFNQFLACIPNLFVFLLLFPIVSYVSQYIEDLILTTAALVPFWQLPLSLIKFLVFIWNKNKIVKLIRRIWLKNLEACKEELKIIAEENRKGTIYAKIYLLIVLLTMGTSIISPFIIAYIHYLKGQGYWKHLYPPLKADYFFNTKTVLGYILAFTWDIITYHYVIGIAVGVDTLFAWLGQNIAAQFRIVKLRFNSAAVVSASGDGVRIENEITKSIISCIKYHRYVIDLADTLNDVFKATIFVKFTISFIQIACIAFQFSRATDISQIVYHICFGVAVAMQLMLYCHSAQRVLDQSESVAVGIYDCFQWHNLSIKSKKLLLLPMMRSQKPCLLSGIFFTIDLSLFLAVFQAGGSLMTMLLSLDQEK